MKKIFLISAIVPAVAAASVAAVAFSTPPAIAAGSVEQSEKGSLKGTVVAVDGTPAKKVPVKVYKQQLAGGMVVDEDIMAKKPTKQVTTDDSGRFNITGLDAALYSWRAGSKDPKVGENTGVIRVNEGQVSEIEIKLAKPL